MKRILFFLPVLLSLSSCRVLSPNLMFKTPENYAYADFSGKQFEEYRIAPNDLLEMRIFTNEGLKLIELVPQSGSAMNAASDEGVRFLVDKDGAIRLPAIGNLPVKGLTVKEAQSKVEQAFSEYYIKPFALLKVLNRRVIVFPGNGGTGTVITLDNENVTLLEALALAGGITPNGKANRVKLVRGTADNPQIQLIDLSTVEGFKKANITMQANDIVYVEPVKNVSQGLMSQITPVVALISTTLFLIQLLR